MKLFVVSDVHGFATILKSALDSAGYDPSNEDHLLVCCGDLFDRGTENLEVLRFFERIEKKVIVMGNHDERMLEILYTGKLGEHDMVNGTINTILEFFGKYSVVNPNGPVDFSGKTALVNRLCGFIGEMKDFFETEHYIFVHGWLPNQNGEVIGDWRNASSNQWHDARWTWWVKGQYMPGRSDDKTVVCGHYPTCVSCGDPSVYHGDRFIAIDAGTSRSGRINVLVLEDNLISEL